MTVDLPTPRVGRAAEAAPSAVRVVLNWGRRYSLWVFNFGLACCAIEFIATSMARHDFIRLGVIPFAPGPRQSDLMVVSGTVTDKMAPSIRRLYDQMPEPKYVISYGACSNRARWLIRVASTNNMIPRFGPIRSWARAVTPASSGFVAHTRAWQ